MSNRSAEEMAKLLFPNGLPGTGSASHAEAYLTPEQQEHLRKEVEAMEKRMAAVGIAPTTEKVTEAVSNQISIDTFKGGQRFYSDEELGLARPVTPVIDKATAAMWDVLEQGIKGEKGTKRKAHTFLEEASGVMKQRAELRDADDGERTAAKIAEVFNAITGHKISEADAWTFLIVLKIVRSRNGKFNADDYVDMAAYSGLLGECESVSR